VTARGVVACNAQAEFAADMFLRTRTSENGPRVIAQSTRQQRAQQQAGE
jgi:hypothetical protein